MQKPKLKQADKENLLAAQEKADRKAARREKAEKKAAARYLRRAKRVVEAILHLWLFDSVLSKRRHVTSRKMKNI